MFNQLCYWNRRHSNFHQNRKLFQVPTTCFYAISEWKMPNPGEITECFSCVSQFWDEGGFRWLPFISPASGAAKFFIPDKLCLFNGRHLLLLQMFFDVRCPGPDLSTLDGRQSLSHLICVNTTVLCSGMVLKLCLRPFLKRWSWARFMCARARSAVEAAMVKWVSGMFFNVL